MLWRLNGMAAGSVGLLKWRKTGLGSEGKESLRTKVWKYVGGTNLGSERRAIGCGEGIWGGTLAQLYGADGVKKTLWPRTANVANATIGGTLRRRGHY
jgi:hypothetical protein